jgi:hypothetical protein
MPYLMRIRRVTTIIFAACVVLMSCNVNDPRLDEPIPDGLDSQELDASTDDDSSGQNCDQICTPPANAQVSGCPDNQCNFVCEPGFIDQNRDLPSGTSGNGCEAICSESNDGTETCDDKDNDCDGQVDEGLSRTCGSTDVGPCKFGEEVCRNGVWSECEGSVEPQDETCDDEDNDCDGRIDENLTRTCGTNVGNCQEGEQECRDGTWSPCNGDVPPGTETCNTRDDDCDGMTDENVKIEYYQDNDNDGYGTDPILACGPSGNHNALRGGDCDDTADFIHPGALESCYNDNEDRDCDGKTACDDSDCEDRECNIRGNLGVCQNGSCVLQ